MRIRPRHQRRQRGFTIIEAIGALAIASLLMLGLSAMTDTYVDDVKGQQAALYQGQLVEAAGRYISARYQELVTATGAGGVTPVTVAQLQADGYLPAGWSATNGYGQTPCVLVRQGTPGKLDALVATRGGQAIPERDLPMVALQSGQGGGYISSADTGLARGASWQLATTAYRNVACGGATVLSGGADDGGHLVSSLFYDGPGQLATDFLYRSAVPGRPELNRMNTPLALANGALVSDGAPCGTDAALALESDTRKLLVCGADGNWAPATSWKDPVASFPSLPGAGNRAGDVRMVTALNRAFTWNGAGWVALAVDENGNLTVPGTVNADQVAAASAITSGGTVTAADNITTQKTVLANGVRGDWVVGNYWVESQSLYVNQPVTAGTPCNIPFVNQDGSTGVTWAIGTVKRDENGILLTCAWDSVFRYQNGQLTW